MMHASIATIRSSSAFATTSSSEAKRSSFETTGEAIGFMALNIKSQASGRRRTKTPPAAFEDSNPDDAGTELRRHSESFNLIAKTSRAFLQALGEYQQEHDTAHAPPEALLDSRKAVADKDINDDDNVDTGEEEEDDEVGKEDATDPTESSMATVGSSLTLTSLGARRAWGRLRLHITETAMRNNSKESILGWRFLRQAVSSLSNLEKTRQELYERYLEKPESWTDSIVNCPDHLRFRNFKACPPATIPRFSSASNITDKSSRWSPLSNRNSAPSHVTGTSPAEHVTKSGSVCSRSTSDVVAKSVDARTRRDLQRTHSAFVTKRQPPISAKRVESAKARIIV